MAYGDRSPANLRSAGFREIAMPALARQTPRNGTNQGNATDPEACQRTVYIKVPESDRRKTGADPAFETGTKR